MLSRVADSLYWLSRYIERAENLARLVDVNANQVLNLRAVSGVDPWQAVLYATGSEVAHTKACKEAGKKLDVGRFIALESGYPDSIRSCLANARENARMVRDQIAEEMWLELNRAYLFIQSERADEEWKQDQEAFYHRIIEFSLLFQGLTDATVLHDEGWRFTQLGKFIERADKTSRILDMLTYGPEPDRAQCTAVLRSCSALSAFRQEFRGEATLWNVTAFLMFSQSFPRSIRFCLRRLDEVLHSISGVPAGAFSNEAERRTGSLLAKLNFAGLDDVRQSGGLHEYIDQLQVQFNDIGQRIYDTYVKLPFEQVNVDRMESQLQRQQQHQQQQQQQS